VITNQESVIQRLLAAACRAVALLAAIALLLMMAVAFLDVLFRQLGRPVTGAFELTALLVGVLVFAALPAVTAGDEHVRAGVLGALLGRRAKARAAIGLLRRLALSLLLAILAWALFSLGARFAETGDAAPFVDIPLAPIAWFGAAALALSSVAALFARRTGGGTGH
jgi:TRAP-type C4-dicarboxylate transport system permease small subunit